MTKVPVPAVPQTPTGGDSRSMHERMVAGNRYVADDPKTSEAANVALDLMAASNATSPRQDQLRRRLLDEPLGGDNVWLRGGVIVCPGSTIGDDTVVGAGAVVARDLPANVLALGNPARVVREIGR